jgi:hypothetical protein
MKLLLLVMFVALFLVSCEKIEGHLNVNRELALVNSKGMTHLLRAGTYTADVSTQSSRKFTLRLNNDSDERFFFKHAENIPDNGSFSIDSNSSGQPVDLKGEVSTVVKNSDYKSEFLTCSYRTAVQVCSPSPRGGMECRIEYRIIYGHQWVTYYIKETNRHVEMDISAANSSEVAADFRGDIRFFDRIITNEARCM